MLIVASPTTSLLCTSVPVPHDRQPQWWWCVQCGERTLAPFFPDRTAGHLHGRKYEPMFPDGPFPFTVAVWSEVRWCSFCDGFGCEDADHGPHWTRVGAIVALVEVTGPSHHADDPECANHPGGWFSAPGVCHPDALPNCWHTPTGEVTRLDPVPCERPPHRHTAECHDIPWSETFTHGSSPADVWVADPALADRLREVKA